MEQNKQAVLDEYDINQIESLAHEYGRLMDWFKEDFPESTMRLEVNNDKRNGTLNYILTVMSGSEMTENQRLMSNTISINRDQFENLGYMSALIRSIYPNYKKVISEEFNKEYQRQKGVLH